MNLTLFLNTKFLKKLNFKLSFKHFQDFNTILRIEKNENECVLKKGGGKAKEAISDRT